MQPYIDAYPFLAFVGVLPVLFTYLLKQWSDFTVVDKAVWGKLDVCVSRYLS